MGGTSCAAPTETTIWTADKAPDALYGDRGDDPIFDDDVESTERTGC